jgi:hypothetical protein
MYRKDLSNDRIQYLGTNGVKFINENDGWGLLFCQGKGIAHQLGSVSDEHLYHKHHKSQYLEHLDYFTEVNTYITTLGIHICKSYYLYKLRTS